MRRGFANAQDVPQMRVAMQYPVLRIRRVADFLHRLIEHRQTSARFSPRIEEAENDTKCFQKPIAIEPFVEYFQKLIGETPPAIT